jgi:hypothetical protein
LTNHTIPTPRNAIFVVAQIDHRMTQVPLISPAHQPHNKHHKAIQLLYKVPLLLPGYDISAHKTNIAAPTKANNPTPLALAVSCAAAFLAVLEALAALALVVVLEAFVADVLAPVVVVPVVEDAEPLEAVVLLGEEESVEETVLVTVVSPEETVEAADDTTEEDTVVESMANWPL